LMSVMVIRTMKTLTISTVFLTCLMPHSFLDSFTDDNNAVFDELMKPVDTFPELMDALTYKSGHLPVFIYKVCFYSLLHAYIQPINTL
jgi:hypothetical protein